MKKTFFIKHICFLLLFTGMTACTYTGAVRTGIAPMTTTDRSYGGDVDLLIDPAINSAEVTSGVGVHTVKISAGSALNSAIVEAARVVFPRVSPQSSPQALKKSNYIIQARLNNISASTPIEQGFWSSRTNITTQVSVVIEMDKKDGSVIYRQVVTGTGLESRSVGSADKVRDGVQIALERAIQQVADGTASVLITGLERMKSEQDEALSSKGR